MINKHFTILFLCCLFLLNCKKELWVFDSPANQNLELPLLLNINDKPCALDIESKTFRFPIPQKSISNFSAKINFQKYSSVKFNDILLDNGVLNDLGDVEVNIPYEIEFTTQNERNTFIIYFTNLATIQLVTLNEIKNEPKSFARILINYGEEDLPSFNSIIGIENRGITSLSHPKKSMGLRLLQDFDLEEQYSTSLFNKAENSDWVLDGMYLDEAQSRNKTSLKLWQSFPQDVEHLGTSCEYVEVFLNYESLGLYTFCEKLTYEFLSLNPESILITGKQNLPTTYFKETPKSTPSGPFWAGWEQKVPESKFGNNWDALEDLSDLVIKGSDQDFIQEIFNHIHLETFIDYYLFSNTIKGYDGVAKNWFLLKKSNSEPIIIVPWDLDSTWGRDWNAKKVTVNGHVSNGIFDRLFELNPDNFIGKLKARWQLIKDNELSPSTLKMLYEENFETLNQSDIVLRNNQKWNINIDLNTEKAYLFYWIDTNWDYLDNYISGL